MSLIGEQLRPRVLNAAIKRVGMAVQGDAIERAKALQAYLVRTTPNERLADCDTCGGTSDIALPACPYCGEADKLVAPTPVLSPTVAAFDSALSELFAAKSAMSSGAWHLGRVLARVRDEQLWRARGAHTSFEGFVKNEAGMTVAWALDLIRISRNFTEEDVRQMGPSKLGFVLRAPMDQRATLLEAARNGVPRRELERRMLAARAGRPAPQRLPRQLSFRIQDGAVFHAKFTSRAGAHVEPARDLSDGPVAEVLLSRTISLHVGILRAPDGTLRGSVRVYRRKA